jgi:hypothetical protein
VAIAKVKNILDNNFPSHIPEEIDAKIREYLPIALPREKMIHPALRGEPASV